MAQLIPKLEGDLKATSANNSKQMNKVTQLLTRYQRDQEQCQPLSVQAKEYVKQLIIDMELEQIAESIVRVVRRLPVRRLNSTLEPIKQEAVANRPSKLVRKHKKADPQEYLF